LSDATLPPAVADAAEGVRGSLVAGAPLADLTWFRVGGPAEVLFQPADVEDLARFLERLSPDVPVTVLGLGSNVLVRDAGIRGVVVRLSMRGFGRALHEAGDRVRVGAALPDKRLAEFARGEGLGGFAFYHGIPGGVGGAIRMNAGANRNETADRLIEVRAVDRSGRLQVLSREALGYSYRHSAAPADLIFVEALFQGVPSDPDAVAAEMAEVQAHREAAQPVRERTGGSTFKNPPGESAWKLIDAAGCRGLRCGGAQVSDMHTNFLVNTGNATAAELERLGETVRARVHGQSGIELEWEIVRLGG